MIHELVCIGSPYHFCRNLVCRVILYRAAFYLSCRGRKKTGTGKGHIAKAVVRSGSVVLDIAGNARGFDATIGALELPKSFSPLMGGATYQVNGILAPPLSGTATVGSFNTINNLFRYINTNGVDADQPPFYEIVVNITNNYVVELRDFI